MKERQRWRAEEDAILRAYVKQYGAREWNLVSQRMNVFLERDAKSCLERWKNYLRPGIKKGSLTEEEQRLVITLQSKHGNKWKKIAAEVPGRTAKRLGKWWEVFKEKQQRQLKQSNRANSSCIDPGKYDRILENFAEKLVKQQQRQLLVATPPLQLPPWLTSSPTVALSLSPTAPSAAPWPFIETTRTNLKTSKDAFLELAECCGELEKGFHAWAEHKKEASWRLKRVELQLEAEKACKKKEKKEEFESMVRKLWEEQQQALERIEFDCMKHLLVVMKDAEAVEQMLTELWASKYAALSKLLLQMSCDRYH